MSDLIAGEQALEALSKGEDVLTISKGMEHTGHWDDSEDTKNFTIYDFFSGQWSFKIKPKTMLLNGIEIPSPFKPECGELYYMIVPNNVEGYGWNRAKDNYNRDRFLQFGVW